MNRIRIQTAVQPAQTAFTANKRTARNITAIILPILTAIFLLIGGTGCDVLMSDQQVINSVKEGKLNGYPNKTVGKAFDDFLGNPVWTEFTADSGEHVVQVKGKCTYMNNPVTLILQFLYNDDDNTFSIYTMTINDVPQNRLMQVGLLSAVYDE